MLVRVQVQEELLDLVDHLRRAGVRPVDLVDHEDDGEPSLQRLPQHEPGLGERTLAGVDQQQHAVHHRQGSLDLAAEVRVPGRVDDVDLDPAVVHGGVLRQDRDALLTFEVHRVHDALRDVLVLAERAGLPQHRVDQGRLAVVDVSDDRDVAQVFAEWHAAASLHGPLPGRPCARR